MNILHVVGNEVVPSNGIGRLIPELLESQNQDSEELSASLLVLNGEPSEVSFSVYRYSEVIDDNDFLSQFDLLVFHGVYFIQYLSISKAAIKLGVPYLVKPHSSLMIEAQKKSRWKKKLVNLLLFNRFISGSSGLLYTNIDEQRGSLPFSVRFFIEPNGLNFPKLNTGLREFGVPPRFVCLSRIDYSHKGIDILLDALALIKEKAGLSSLKLDIYGKGSQEEESLLQATIAELGSQNIRFCGPVYGDEKFNMFNENDIFVLSSRYEGFPMAVLEAMYSGLPCLVTRGVNMSEIIHQYNTGWMVETESRKLADKMIELLETSHSELKQKSDNANSYVVENHNWNVVTKITRKIYLAVLGGV